MQTKYTKIQKKKQNEREKDSNFMYIRYSKPTAVDEVIKQTTNGCTCNLKLECHTKRQKEKQEKKAKERKPREKT